jgi:capsid protein
MNFLDILLKPFTGSQNQKALTLPVGGMEGAQRFSTDRSYIYIDETEQEVPTFARTEILSMTRYLVKNFALMERVLTLCESYAVNAGILAQGATEDSDFNDAATAYFDRWATSPYASTTAEVNLYDMQKLIVRELLIAGEIFIVMSKSKDGYPQLTLVTSEQVRHTGKKTDKSVDGIVYDNFGKALGYQVFFTDRATYVEAANVIHLKRFKSVNQRRGVSAFAASLNSVRDIKDLQILEKKSIKVHSALAATVTKKSGEMGDGLFGGGRKAKTAAAANPAPATAARNTLLEKVFGGAIAYLNEGEKVDLVASSRSTDGFLKFVELLTRDVCLNLSLPYELVVNPTALSSAATRFVIQDADFLFKSLQNILTDGAMNRIYSWVIASAQNDKKIKANKNWYLCSWVFPQSATIDAGRKDSAELAFVEKGLVSYDSFFASRGKNWKEQLRQVAIEKAYIKELEAEYGVVIDSTDVSRDSQTDPTE